MRIFVDAMGGDLAPQAPVEGTVEALRRNPELTVTLAGIVPEIEKYLAGADDGAQPDYAAGCAGSHYEPRIPRHGRAQKDEISDGDGNAGCPRQGSGPGSSPPGLRAQCWRAACSGWGVFRAWSVRRLPR